MAAGTLLWERSWARVGLAAVVHGPAAAVSVFFAAADAAATVGDSIVAAANQRDRGGRLLVGEVVVACADRATAAAAESAVIPDPVALRVVGNPSGKTPDGLNLAAGACSGQVLVRVDAHVCLPDGYVARALETVTATGAANVAACQLPTAPAAAGRVQRAASVALRTPLGHGGAAYRGGRVPRRADTGYLGVFDRAAFELVGGYDRRLWRNQDAELNLRLAAAGFSVWVDPELRVLYPPRRSLRALARQYFDYGRFRRLTVRLHPGSLRLRQVAPAALVLLLVMSAAAAVAGWWWLPAVTAGGYGGLLVAGACFQPRGERALLPVVWAVTHLSWGVGFVVGPPRQVWNLPAVQPGGR